MSLIVFLLADLDPSVFDRNVDLTKFWDGIKRHKLVYKYECGEHDRPRILIRGGVDPTDESQITRMKVILEGPYMQFVHAHVVEVPADAALSVSDDDALI